MLNKRLLFIWMLMTALMVSGAFAEVPEKISIQGVLIGPNGPIKGMEKVTFTFYRDQNLVAPGQPSAANTDVPTNFKDGFFSATVEVTDVSFSGQRFLKITVLGKDFFQPLYSVPSAIVAKKIQYSTDIGVLGVGKEAGGSFECKSGIAVNANSTDFVGTKSSGKLIGGHFISELGYGVSAYAPNAILGISSDQINGGPFGKVAIAAVSSGEVDALRAVNFNNGVAARAVSTNGTGVNGKGKLAGGVFESDGGPGVTAYGYTGGVKGESYFGDGVYGFSANVGVHGSTESGVGVKGQSHNQYGVSGYSDLSYGVFGIGKTAGVCGNSEMENGAGVKGVSDNITGRALYGHSTNGWGLYVESGKSYVQGNLGIGVVNPSKAKLEVSGFTNYTLNNFAYFAKSNSNTAVSGFMASQEIPLSIYAGSRIAANQFDAFSDRRIKKIVGLSKGEADLKTLNKLEVTDFNYIDKANYGNKVKKGFIAQQVEKVYPEAVSKIADFIPNIYQVAESAVYDSGSKVLKVTLKKEADLKAGDIVRLIADQEYEKEVVKVSGRSFTVKDWGKETKQLFVYGKKVKDFRSLDYDHVFSLGISAVQELSRQVKAQQAEIETLKREIAELKNK